MNAAIPEFVTVRYDNGTEFELLGSRPCIRAGSLDGSQYLVEWVLPLNRAQATAGTMMFMPVLSVGEVANLGGGMVLALVDNKTVHLEGTGIMYSRGQPTLQARFLGFFLRVRVLGVNEKRAKDGVPMTLVRE